MPVQILYFSAHVFVAHAARLEKEVGRMAKERAEQVDASDRGFCARYGVRPTERSVDVQDGNREVRLRVQETGNGDPVLFIHGTGGPGTYFAPLARHVADRRCLFLDRPGWGGSQPIAYAGRSYGEVTAKLVGGVLDNLGVERTDIVGASVGGLWAFRFAQAAPDRVGRIVQLGGGPLNAEVQISRFLKLLRSPVGRAIAALPEKPPMLRKQLASLGHAPDAFPDAFIAWHVQMSRTTDWSRNEREMVRAVIGRDGFRPGVIPREDEVAAIRQPVLMIFGSNDPFGSVDVWRRYTQRLPDGSLAVIDGGGHLVWYDDVERVGNRIRSFLTS
jgi:pimeloyl-ACP methyl ester carboxylesterase